MPMTRDVALMADGGWSLVANDAKFIAVQLKSAGRIGLFLQADGDAAPDMATEGIALARGIQGTESAFSAGGLPPGTSLWLRSIGDNEDVTLVTY